MFGFSTGDTHSLGGNVTPSSAHCTVHHVSSTGQPLNVNNPTLSLVGLGGATENATPPLPPTHRPTVALCGHRNAIAVALQDVQPAVDAFTHVLHVSSQSLHTAVPVDDA